MFKERSPGKTFDKCEVKVVELKTFVFKKGNHGETEITKKPSEDPRLFAGVAAELHCPRTEDDRVKIESQYSNHPNKMSALESVRKLAGELLCKNCRFSRMTPAEVSRDRAEFARAETERVTAIIARDAAIKELKEKTGIDNWE